MQILVILVLKQWVIELYCEDTSGGDKVTLLRVVMVLMVVIEWVVMVRMDRILEDIIGNKVVGLCVELVGVLVNRIKRIRYKL